MTTQTTPRARVCVLISGNGSNLQALIDACARHEMPAEIIQVISNRADAFGLQRAQKAGIPTAVHYPIPLNRQPAVKDDAACLPVGDAIAERVMSLPMHPYLGVAQQATIIQSLQESLGA